jgi:hypothetical protein
MQVARWADDVARLKPRLEAKDVVVVVAPCLSSCLDCAAKPIARFDGTPISAASFDALAEDVLGAVGG